MRSGCAKVNRCRPRWTLRFPDPGCRESATPFSCWRATLSLREKVHQHAFRHFAKKSDARNATTTHRVQFALRLAKLAEADLGPQIRTSEPKDQECKFAKRTHLNHEKSVVFVSQCQRKQHGYDDIGAKARRKPTRSQTTAKSQSP